MVFRLSFIVGVLILTGILSAPARAGGGPETTLLVVNADSPISLGIANYYSRLRDVPPENIVHLHGVTTLASMDIDEFRRVIWEPIETFMVKHALEREIDTITYSTDFPYSITFTSELKRHDIPGTRYLGQHASLTGLTFFARRVAAGDPGFLGVNHYFRNFAGPIFRTPEVSSETLDEDTIKNLKQRGKHALAQRD